MNAPPCAVVTGAARGIGLAIARRLAHDGWRVVIADTDTTRGPCAADQLPGTSFRVTDVSDETSVEGLFAELRTSWDGLDLLVNNAAIADPVTGPIESLQPSSWRRLIDVNLTSAYLCTHFAVPLLRARGGTIVNIASTRALQSEPHCEAYAAAKGGLVALTHALAVSLGPDIRVNAVSPGWIDTSASATDPIPEPAELNATDHAQHPAGRVGDADDVAQAVAWLASSASAFMTGENLVLDGGMRHRMIYAE